MKFKTPGEPAKPKGYVLPELTIIKATKRKPKPQYEIVQIPADFDPAEFIGRYEYSWVAEALWDDMNTMIPIKQDWKTERTGRIGTGDYLVKAPDDEVFGVWQSDYDDMFKAVEGD